MSKLLVITNGPTRDFLNSVKHCQRFFLLEFYIREDGWQIFNCAVIRIDKISNDYFIIGTRKDYIVRYNAITKAGTLTVI